MRIGAFGKAARAPNPASGPKPGGTPGPLPAAPPGTPSASALAAHLPGLLIEAERVAATVAQGLHGRRRVGTGENFWQFRPFVAGDTRSRIDWRRSGRSDQLYLRETEWDAAQTLALWCDGAASMRWRSSAALPCKYDRAALLLLALAALALRGGERVRLLDGDVTTSGSGTAALSRIAASLSGTAGLPRTLPPAHGRMVLFGDFLGDLDALRLLLGRLAALSVGGELIQILDPAELELPYAGRVRFVGVGDPRAALVPKVESVRARYQDRLAAHQETLARLCRSAGFGYAVHRTDAPPIPKLAALHQALAGG